MNSDGNQRLLSALDALSHEAGECTERARLCFLTVAEAASLASARAGALYLLDGQKLKLTAGWPEVRPPARDEIELGYGIAGWAAKNGKLLKASDKGGDASVAKFEQLAVPLVAAGAVTGVIHLEIASPHEVTEEEEKLLTRLAAHAGGLIKLVSEKRALRDERDLLEDILGSSPNGVIALDRRRRVLMMNSAAHRFTFTKDQPEAVKGNPVERYLPQPAFLEALDRVISGAELETIEIESGPAHAPGNFSVKIFRPVKLAWVGATVLMQDLTKQRKIDAEIQRMDRVASIGQLAAGIAHEIRNPLTGIAITLDILREQEKLTDAGGEMLADIMREIDRLEALIKGLLDYARPQPASRRPMRVAKALEWQRSFIEQCRKKEVACEIDIDANPKIEGDPEKLKQLFLNLAINALDATDAGGRVTIRSTFDRQGKLGPRVRVEVIDTGRGMDQATAGRVFDPFFTTKNEGTGLGLSIAHSIVEQHGGQIRIETAPGKGTTFAVSLPVHEE